MLPIQGTIQEGVLWLYGQPWCAEHYRKLVRASELRLFLRGTHVCPVCMQQAVNGVVPAGQHYHYTAPHEHELCQNDDCPGWLALRLPDGRCDAPWCRECRSADHD